MALADRSVGLGWLLVFSMALVLALAGMTPLLGELVSFPKSRNRAALCLRLGLSDRAHPPPLDRTWGYYGLLRPDKPGVLFGAGLKTARPDWQR